MMLLGNLLLLMTHTTLSLKSSQTCTGYDCLKNYVDTPDPLYSWYDTGNRINVSDPLGPGTGWMGYVLNMTSQQWLTINETDMPVWWHTLVVVVPDNLWSTADIPILWVVGGHNKVDFLPEWHDEDMLIAADIAVATHSVVGVLFHIPNQPIVYADDPLQKHRSEGASIAFTWWKFINDPVPDAEWLLRLPMTKSCVRALDTIQDFLTNSNAPAKVRYFNLNPTQFIVAGASKRGWATWTVAAVEPRVMAIIPIVMDELNFIQNIKHHWRSYGGWSFTLEDYWEMNITTKFNDPRMQKMCDIIDVYEYREKLLMPKFVCNAAGDEFFLPDDTQYWWHDMPQAIELNRLITVPNAEHSMITGLFEILPAVTTWARAILSGDQELRKRYGGARPPVKTIGDRNAASLELMAAAQIPQYNWTIDPHTGDITVKADREPLSVHLWYSNTCNAGRRDFRLINIDDPCKCGISYDDKCVNFAVLWNSKELQETEPGSLIWVAHRDPPVGGLWTAFFVDLQFEGPSPSGWPIGKDGTFEFTTSVSVIPKSFPFSDCFGADCYGDLV